MNSKVGFAKLFGALELKNRKQKRIVIFSRNWPTRGAFDGVNFHVDEGNIMSSAEKRMTKR